MTKPLCIYHGNCADGFAAAWVVRYFYGEENVDFWPGVYGETPPLTEGRDVIMVDFSYKRWALDIMAQHAKSILILDHHKTARDDLSHYPSVPAALIHEVYEPPLRGWIPDKGVYVTFDMERSGAMLAWDHFWTGMTPPKLLQHIQDRDLWLFKLEGTREIHANIFSYPYDFAVWDELMRTDPQTLRSEGAAIERKHHMDINELVGVSKRRMKIGGYDVPVANLPYTLSSDAGHLMAKGEPFACCYMDAPNGRTFSLRSAPDGLDVSAIAKAYGGGGHQHASGFTMPIGWEGDA